MDVQVHRQEAVKAGVTEQELTEVIHVAAALLAGSGKPFEVVYTLIWYIGAVNHASPLDFTLPTSHGPWNLRFLLSTAILLAIAWIGRWRALRS